MKKVFFFLFFVAGISLNTQAQTVSSPASTAGSGEQLPSFLGGNERLQGEILKNLDLTKIAERVQGSITVYFMVDAAGNAYNHEVLNEGLSRGQNDAVLTAVRGVSKWKPGSFGTNPVIMGHKVTVTF